MDGDGLAIGEDPPVAPLALNDLDDEPRLRAAASRLNARSCREARHLRHVCVQAELTRGHVGYGPVMDAGRSTAAPRHALLLSAAAAAEAHRAALRDESAVLIERDRAIVRAIRAGARLDEVAEAASISRAAVSKTARRILPTRTGRGGPYSRRRGSAAAVEEVATAAQRLTDVRARLEDTKQTRDLTIVAVVSRGAGVSETARVVRLTPASVSVIARSGVENPGHNLPDGAVASAMK